MAEQKNHQVSLFNREELKIQGVKKVESFDDEEIILETIMGVLALKGKNLHINHLDLDTGDLAVIGFIKTLQYLEQQAGKSAKGKGKSFISRLLK